MPESNDLPRLTAILPQRAAVAAEETANGECTGKDNSCHRAAIKGVAEERIQHLHPVPLAAAIDESVCVICAWESLALWHWDFEKLGQWLVAHAHLVLQEVLLWHERADFIVVLLEPALAVLLEVAFPELGPELCNQLLAYVVNAAIMILVLTRKHWLVHACCPVNLGGELQLRLSRTPVHRLHRASMPAIDITGCDEHLSLWVCLNEFLCECNARPIADGLAVAEQLIPLFTAECANTIVFCSESIRPHQAVWWVLDGCGHHVVAFCEA